MSDIFPMSSSFFLHVCLCVPVPVFNIVSRGCCPWLLPLLNKNTHTHTQVLLDSVEEVFRESPGIVALVTLVVVFAMAGLAFRSCLIPVRLLGTVVVTLIFVAGSTVLMYQYILGYDGIYWFVPICTACLVIGLTIDYDVFLISRIYEFRQSGYTTEASILRAMAKQSTTITTAGIIMTMAFSSLLLSKTVVLNQFGFVLVAASLIDTFIVRTLLVPSLMFMAVETNWWPGAVPVPFKKDLVDGPPLGGGRTGRSDSFKIGGGAGLYSSEDLF